VENEFDWWEIQKLNLKMAALPKYSFSLALFLFQVLLLALFAKYATYGSSNISDIYPRK
jgi:hypothetical protein